MWHLDSGFVCMCALNVVEKALIFNFDDYFFYSELVLVSTFFFIIGINKQKIKAKWEFVPKSSIIIKIIIL